MSSLHNANTPVESTCIEGATECASLLAEHTVKEDEEEEGQGEKREGEERPGKKAEKEVEERHTHFPKKGEATGKEEKVEISPGEEEEEETTEKEAVTTKKAEGEGEKVLVKRTEVITKAEGEDVVEVHIKEDVEIKEEAEGKFLKENVRVIAVEEEKVVVVVGGGEGENKQKEVEEVVRKVESKPTIKVEKGERGERGGGVKASEVEQKHERKDNKIVSNAKWQNLQNLQNLLNAGFITKTEYRDRKSQLIDELTGTTISTATMSTAATRRPSTEITVVPKAPPDFTMMLPESATKHVYDLAARKWSSSKVRIKLDTVPFAKGGLRLVYHMQELDCDETEGTYVAKLSMDANDRDDQDIYFRDVEMQSVAKYYAKLFNEYNPPKKVDFVKAWLLQLDDREGSPLCGVERFIDGPYRKHNNNFGFVSDDERNTPQSFSHFSYESSNHGLLVCDIQGVSDLYTDPQVHSADGQSFGKGNLGQRGIDRFIQSHRCNAICRYLKLPSINANYAGLGTLPVTQYMKHTRVEVVHIGSFPRLERPAPLTDPLSQPLLEPVKEETLCRFCALL